MSEEKKHRSGFVNIVGRPNVGKSSLMNALLGDKMVITTAKPQTTRHRILGILNGDNYQIVFSDTPGLIQQPKYEMQEVMNRYVQSTFEDADIMLFMVDAGEDYPEDHPLITKLRSLKVPIFLLINKIDTASETRITQLKYSWKNRLDFAEIIPISALHGLGLDVLMQKILQHLPEGPAYYPKDFLSDRPERFFVAELIREKILLLYQQEVPYAVEVIVERFKEGQTKNRQPLVRIEAWIFVERATQKGILIGKGGEAIKKLGTLARQDIEKFLGKKVFLELRVKVRKDWRNDPQWLKRLGYH